MKALSIKQPWAWAILFAGKDIENRSWYTAYRGLFLIHAGKKIDKQGWYWLKKQEGNLFEIKVPAPNEFSYGGIVGYSRLIDCIDYGSSPWFFGPKGFKLVSSTTLKFLPYKGQLGFFNVEETNLPTI